MFISLKKILFESDIETIKMPRSKSGQAIDIRPTENTGNPIEAIKKIATDRNMDNLTKVKAMYNIAEASLTRKGGGSNRSAYAIDGGKIIKISYAESRTYDVNDAMSQTKAEIDAMKTCPKAVEEELIPRVDVGQSDPDGLFLIADEGFGLQETSPDADKESLAKYFGFENYEKFKDALTIIGKEKYERNYTSSLSPDEKKAVEDFKSKWAPRFKALESVIYQCKFSVGDMLNLANWGNFNGKYMLLDTGLTDINRAEIIKGQTARARAIAGGQP